MVSLTINNRAVQVPEGTTILEAARAAGIHIPTLCFLKDINEIGACRVCCVEIQGKETLVSSCNTKVEEGMVVLTSSQKARHTRQNEPPNHSVTARFPLCSMSEEWKLYSAKNLLGYEHQQYAVPAVL